MIVSHQLEVDAAVVGGGPAGATAASAMAGRGLRVALLEASRNETPRLGETLPPVANPLLKRLGVWNAFRALDPVPSYENRSAWGGPELSCQEFVFSPFGHGWHLDRTRFDAMLMEQAERAGTVIRSGFRVTRCQWAGNEGWELVGRSGRGTIECIRARGLIAASGRSSGIARSLDGRRRVQDRMVALAVTFAPRDEVPPGFTMVEATPRGWWYSAPLPHRGLMVMRMTDADLLTDHDRTLDGWWAALTRSRHTLARCDKRSVLGGLRIGAAFTHRLRRGYDTGPWLAVGDAALAADPLSSSGIVRALRSGVQAAGALSEWIAGDRSSAAAYEHGLDEEFADYESQRRRYYDMETRWPGEPFWRRRRSGTRSEE